MTALRSTAWMGGQPWREFVLVAGLGVLLLSGSAAAWPTQPPEQAALHTQWMRHIDGMTMVYVPAGEFTMGLDEENLDYVMDLCMVFNPG